MNKELKKLLSFLIKTIVLVFIIDFLTGMTLNHFYGTMKGGERSRANYIIRESKDQLIILGSSRAWNHYMPEILEDSLGISCYNAGRSAQSLLYQKTILEMILARHKPEYVVLDLNENDLVLEERKYEIFKSLMPYYKTNTIFKREYDLVNPSFRFFGWLHSLTYNSSAFSVLYRNLRPELERHKGFHALPGSRVKEVKRVDNCNEVIQLDSSMADALKKIIELCETNGIRLFCVFSPRATEFKCERVDFTAVKNLLRQQGVHYFSFVENPKFRSDLKLMHDPSHLSGEGAIIFSRDLAHLLKTEIGK